MIRYVQHSDIDRAQWDACIDAAVNAMPYAYAWYLDIVSGNSWDALVVDDYRAVFPIPVTRRFFVRKAYEPFFTQQLGLFYQHAEDAQWLTACLEEVSRRFRRWRLHLNTGNAVDASAFHVQMRRTHHVQLSGSYADLERAYSTQTHRNLKRARQHPWQVLELPDASMLLAMRRKELADVIRQGRQKEDDTQRLGALINECIRRGKGTVLAAAGPNGDVQSVVFLLNSNGKLIYLSAVSTETGKKLHAMTFLIDHIFQSYAASGLLFDFEGSMQPGLARYYQGFGGVAVPFAVVSKS